MADLTPCSHHRHPNEFENELDTHTLSEPIIVKCLLTNKLLSAFYSFQGIGCSLPSNKVVIIDVFSPSVPYILLNNTRKASQERGIFCQFEVDFCMWVFSNKTLSYSWMGNRNTIPLASAVLKRSEFLLTNNS